MPLLASLVTRRFLDGFLCKFDAAFVPAGTSRACSVEADASIDYLSSD